MYSRVDEGLKIDVEVEVLFKKLASKHAREALLFFG